MKTKRTFDLILAGTGLLVLAPLLVVIAVLIILDSKGGAIYRQARVGRNKKEFGLYKFRTMHVQKQPASMLTIGDRDPRVTRVGYWLRKYKIDELPQLLNILNGNMSLVGPRPEVKKYVDLYTNEQMRVLSVRPGITDWASIYYSNESEILALAPDPEAYYIQEIMPSKIRYNLQYIENPGIGTDVKILFETLKAIVRK